MHVADAKPGRRFLYVASPSPDDCRHARRRLGWTIDQLAHAAGVTKATVRDYERGHRTPREGTAIAIRRALRDAGVAGLAGGRT